MNVTTTKLTADALMHVMGVVGSDETLSKDKPALLFPDLRIVPIDIGAPPKTTAFGMLKDAMALINRYDEDVSYIFMHKETADALGALNDSFGETFLGAKVVYNRFAYFGQAVAVSVAFGDPHTVPDDDRVLLMKRNPWTSK
jgi:hypothetical protein